MMLIVKILPILPIAKINGMSQTGLSQGISKNNANDKNTYTNNTLNMKASTMIMMLISLLH